MRKELDALEAQRPSIKKAIAAARAMGDLRENAEYHAAREQLGMLNARISQIGEKLANSIIVDTSKAPKGKMVLGRTVKIRREKDKKELVRTIVGEGETDPSSGRILSTSPIGKAVLGHEVGDKVTAILPAGAEIFTIIEIN